jgi:hypothetical protein
MHTLTKTVRDLPNDIFPNGASCTDFWQHEGFEGKNQ